MIPIVEPTIFLSDIYFVGGALVESWTSPLSNEVRFFLQPCETRNSCFTMGTGKDKGFQVKLQKVCKCCRTQGNLVNSAVLVEKHWWRALDFSAIKPSSISFFNIEKPEIFVSG
ncbi:hypothetical protein MKW98_016119 [Papaver atlanticum]|uniref:Uncharacterized protein n=1 Tax=Papaver atlanticum TaxID=357466 RepID=A0AAD4T3H8_9MAGN|nr:hypothetical protein MKW98_016119 [Papaver atlanticum]